MAYAAELELDQQRIEIQDTISLIYRERGMEDGYIGTYPQQQDYDYLAGYVLGVWRYRAENPVLGQEQDPINVPF